MVPFAGLWSRCTCHPIRRVTCPPCAVRGQPHSGLQPGGRSRTGHPANAGISFYPRGSRDMHGDVQRPRRPRLRSSPLIPEECSD